MLNKKIARRYARALIELGKEESRIEQYQKELKIFSGLLSNFPELERCLSSPLYSAEDLKQIIAGITEKIEISKTIQNFLYLLVDKKRSQYLADIIESFNDFTNEIFGFVKAKLITAATLSDKDYDLIKESLEKVTEKKVILTTVVDPHIIGGVIAEVGDKVFDGSIKNQLQKIGETLT